MLFMSTGVAGHALQTTYAQVRVTTVITGYHKVCARNHQRSALAHITVRVS